MLPEQKEQARVTQDPMGKEGNGRRKPTFSVPMKRYLVWSDIAYIREGTWLCG